MCAGVGPGSGHRQGLTLDGFSCLVAADLAWRHGPARSFVLSLEIAGVQAGIGIPESPRLGHVGHTSILVGVERSVARPGFGPYFHGSLGLGRLTSEEQRQVLPAFGGDPARSLKQTSSGLALGGGAGYRLVSPARELGLDIGMRTGLATRKVPGRRGMSWEEEHRVDEGAISHRGPED